MRAGVTRRWSCSCRLPPRNRSIFGGQSERNARAQPAGLAAGHCFQFLHFGQIRLTRHLVIKSQGRWPFPGGDTAGGRRAARGLACPSPRWAAVHQERQHGLVVPEHMGAASRNVRHHVWLTAGSCGTRLSRTSRRVLGRHRRLLQKPRYHRGTRHDWQW